MVKSFLILLTVYGVSCAPGVPFAKYGIPQESGGEELLSTPQLPGVENLEEKSVPVSRLQRPSIPFQLPGTRNLDEHPQVPETLPGTRNLGEKAIPDSITLRKLPTPTAPVFPKSEIETVPSIPQGIAQPQAPVAPAQSESGEELFSEAVPPPQKETPEKFPGAVIIPPGTKLKLEDNRGQYSHGFATPEGIEVQETGHLITTNGGWEYVIAKEGSYSYVSPEGIPITVNYVADHNGFRITGQSFGRR